MTRFTNSTESQYSPHLTKTLINRFITPRLYVLVVSTTSYGAPRTWPQPQTCCIFVSMGFHQDNTNFGSASHISQIDLHFHNSPKPPRASHPWVLVFHLGISALVHCLRIFLDLFSKSLPQMPLCLPLVECPCSYKNSKGHLCETSCLLGVSCPFGKPHSNDSSCSLHGPSAPFQACVPINLHVSWTDILWHCTITLS
jgi:hypothetical protein